MKITILDYQGNQHKGDWNEKLYANLTDDPTLLRLYVSNKEIHATEEEIEKSIPNAKAKINELKKVPEVIEIESGYRFVCKFEDREIAKEAGFTFNFEKKTWETKSKTKAFQLKEYMKKELREKLETELEQKNNIINTLRDSSKDSSDIDIPVPEGLDYLPFQKVSIECSANLDSILIADEMGLGKTIQAIGILNYLKIKTKVIIVTPASLKLNWKKELNRWLVDSEILSILVVKSGKTEEAEIDSADIVIINYDLVSKYSKLRSIEWNCIICDESHYLKNYKAKRTISIVGNKETTPIKANKKIFLSGTPILNRPVELFTTLNYLLPDRFDNFIDYAKRYCDGKFSEYGFDASGASNIDELNLLLRSTVMIRRLKKDVLKQLPNKTREIIALESNLTVSKEKQELKKIVAAAKSERVKFEISKAMSKKGYEKSLEEFKNSKKVLFDNISDLRHKTSLSKIDEMREIIEDIIENQSKVVIMAHHIDLIERLASFFPEQTVSFTGKDSVDKRQMAIDKFQNDPDILIFVGNIMSAGVGITLTAASRLIFVELEWTPALMQQAEDRIHRIGQENKVIIQHYVYEDSIDSIIADTLLKKQQIIDKILDKTEEHSDTDEEFEDNLLIKLTNEKSFKTIFMFDKLELEAKSANKAELQSKIKEIKKDKTFAKRLKGLENEIYKVLISKAKLNTKEMLMIVQLYERN